MKLKFASVKTVNIAAMIHGMEMAYKHESLQFYDEEANRWRTFSPRKWQQVHKWTMYL